MSDTPHRDARHHVTALLENRRDVLSWTVSLLYRRAFEVRGFTLGPTERTDIARLTVVVAGESDEAARLARELGRLVYVLRVDAGTRPAIDRSLALIKVAADAGTRLELIRLCEVFGARLVDVAETTAVLELSAGEARIESFLEVLKPFRILEMACTGPLRMGRADQILGDFDDDPRLSSWSEHRHQIHSKTDREPPSHEGDSL